MASATDDRQKGVDSLARAAFGSMRVPPGKETRTMHSNPIKLVPLSGSVAHNRGCDRDPR